MDLFSQTHSFPDAPNPPFPPPSRAPTPAPPHSDWPHFSSPGLAGSVPSVSLFVSLAPGLAPGPGLGRGRCCGRSLHLQASQPFLGSQFRTLAPRPCGAPGLGLARLPGHRRPMKTQNGRSQRPLAPASLTHCKHQLTLIKKKKKDYKLASLPPAAGPESRREPRREKGSEGRPSLRQRRKWGKSLEQKFPRPQPPPLQTTPPTPPDPFESFPGPESGARAARGWGAPAGPGAGRGVRLAPPARGPATPFQSNGPGTAGGGGGGPGAGPARRRSSLAPFDARPPPLSRFLPLFPPADSFSRQRHSHGYLIRPYFLIAMGREGARRQA